MSKKPFKQGNFDGLCGVYAIMNAINNVLPCVDEEMLFDLFKTCIAKLDRRTKLAKTITEGTTIAMLKEMLNDCKVYVEENTDYIIGYDFITKDKRRITSVIKEIRESLDYSNTTIILGIAGKYFSHWTTIDKKFKDKIVFHDSDDLGKITIDELTTGNFCNGKQYSINPEEVICLWAEEQE